MTRILVWLTAVAFCLLPVASQATEEKLPWPRACPLDEDVRGLVIRWLGEIEEPKRVEARVALQKLTVRRLDAEIARQRVKAAELAKSIDPNEKYRIADIEQKIHSLEAEKAAVLARAPYTRLDEKASGGYGDEIIGGFAAFVADRTKKEVQQWAAGALVDDLCAEAKRPSHYAPNTCRLARKASGLGEVPQVGVLIPYLKKDFHYLPSCAYFQDSQGNSEAYRVQYLMDQLVLHPESAKELLKKVGLIEDEGQEWAIERVLASLRGTAYDKLDSSERVEFALALAAEILNCDADTDSYCPFGASPEEFRKLKGMVHALAAAHANVSVLTGLEVALELGCQKDGSGMRTVDKAKFGNGCRYLLTISRLADAKDEKDVQAVLEDVASPVGAWRQRQQSDVWGIGAFGAAQVGAERISLESEHAWTSTYGLFAPIGFGFSSPSSSKTFGSKGFFISVFDLGARVSYSQAEQSGAITTDGKPSSSGRSLFSPGIYGHFGFRDSPFHFGVGASMTPQLRSASISGGSEQGANSLRILLFFGVDVLMFPHTPRS